jgi:hypothetical protein
VELNGFYSVRCRLSIGVFHAAITVLFIHYEELPARLIVIAPLFFRDFKAQKAEAKLAKIRMTLFTERLEGVLGFVRKGQGHALIMH